MEYFKKDTPIEFSDCLFYTVQDIPGRNQPTSGYWDLRKGVDAYLGYTDFKSKTVLELGPASGFLTFHIEKAGGDVTSIDLSPERDVWDAVPACARNWKADRAAHMETLIRLQNAYWYAHRAHKSKAKLMHGHIYNLPADIGPYDISLMCSVLLHIQNPFLAIQNMLRVTEERAVITELLPTGRLVVPILTRLRSAIFGKTRNAAIPFLQFLPSADGQDPFSWWLISPEAVVRMAELFGFGKTTVTYHSQLHNGVSCDLYTVVCERTIARNVCNY